jgi:hypothetical protein
VIVEASVSAVSKTLTARWGRESTTSGVDDQEEIAGTPTGNELLGTAPAVQQPRKAEQPLAFVERVALLDDLGAAVRRKHRAHVGPKEDLCVGGDLRHAVLHAHDQG